MNCSKLKKLGPSCAAALLLALGLQAGARAADSVSVQLDWVVRGDHAPFFIAKEKGYFTQQGLDVTDIRKGSGSPNALRLVGNGNADFGFADLPTLMVARSQNVPVTALVAVNQETPLAIIAIKKNFKLVDAESLKGANVGVQPAGSTYIFLKAFLAKNGMSLADIKQSTVSPPYESYLLLNRVNVVPGYIDAEVPELEAKAGGPGSLSILTGADAGLHIYGSGLFTSDKNIAERPDVVQRFVDAYMKGFAYMVQHPEEAADIIIEDNPEYASKKQVLVEEIQADIDKTLFSQYTKQHGIGYISGEEWKNTADTYKQQDALDKDFDVTKGFDSRFAEKANPLKR